MGVRDFLKKWALPAAGIAAAPFTGGSSLLATLGGVAKSVLPAIGQVAGQASQGAAKGREAEADILLRQQQLRQQGARDASDDSLRRAQFGFQQQQAGLQNPELFARQALRGGLQANVQDAQIGRPAGSTIPTFNITGGLRPSAMGDDARQAGAEMARRALQQQLSGGPAPIEAGPGYQAPSEPALPKAGGFSKAGSMLGILGGIAGAIPQPQATPGYGGLPPQGLPIGTTPIDRNAGLIPPPPPNLAQQLAQQRRGGGFASPRVGRDLFGGG